MHKSASQRQEAQKEGELRSTNHQMKATNDPTSLGSASDNDIVKWNSISNVVYPYPQASLSRFGN